MLQKSFRGRLRVNGAMKYRAFVASIGLAADAVASHAGHHWRMKMSYIQARRPEVFSAIHTSVFRIRAARASVCVAASAISSAIRRSMRFATKLNARNRVWPAVGAVAALA